MTRSRRVRYVGALALALATSAAACDQVVGVDWDAYVEAPLATPCDGACAAGAKRIDGAGEVDVRGAAPASDGGLLLWGTTDAPAPTLGVGSAGGFVAKTCSAGEPRWASVYDPSAGVRVHAVVSDELGGAWIGGSFTGTVDLGAPPTEPIAAEGAAGFLEHVGSDGVTDRRVALPAPVLALAYRSSVMNEPLAVVLGSAPNQALFATGPCREMSPADATGLHLARLGATGECRNRTRCASVASAADDTPAALAFDATGALIIAAPFQAAGANLELCGSTELAMAGTRGILVARETGAGKFDQDFGNRGWFEGFDPAGPLRIAIDPNDGGVWVAGTTKAPFDFGAITILAPTESMFVLALESVGNPREGFFVGADTTGTSRAGSIAFGPSGHLAFAASYRGAIEWQGTRMAAADDDRILYTDIDPITATRVVGTDPRRSLAPLPQVVSPPGCAPTLVTSFRGGIGATSGELSAEGLDVGVVPSVDGRLFAEP